MALFNHLFPYSNLHDINLDWIISIIKSIDPAVIQALQELTPDIIEQVNQKVTEAQAFAVSAQRSASESNAAKENAATSATEATQKATEATQKATEAGADAVRAENAANEAGRKAETAVANALNPELISMTAVDSYVEGSTIAQCKVSGKSAVITIDCMMTGTKSNEYWTPIYTLGKAVSGTFFGWGYLGGSTLVKAKVENTSVYLESSTITKRESLLLFNMSFITM